METSSGRSEISLLEEEFTTHQHWLRERLCYFVDELQPQLRNDVMRALEEPGKLFSLNSKEDDGTKAKLPAGYWALLPLLIARTINPTIDMSVAGTVAVAVECLMSAIDLLDDVEDDDQTSIILEIGSARALNTSTVLVMLAQRMILSLSQYQVSPLLIIKILHTIQNSVIIAAIGQHQDLLAEKQSVSDFTYRDCLEIAERKGGELLSLACHLGALIAEANEGVCEKFAELGKLLGIVGQFENDNQDLYHILHGFEESSLYLTGKLDKRSVKSDVMREKKTLPIVLASDGNDAEEDKQTEKIKPDIQIFHEGILKSLGVCLLYRQRALTVLKEIENSYSISETLIGLLGLMGANR